MARALGEAKRGVSEATMEEEVDWNLVVSDMESVLTPHALLDVDTSVEPSTAMGSPVYTPPPADGEEDPCTASLQQLHSVDVRTSYALSMDIGATLHRIRTEGLIFTELRLLLSFLPYIERLPNPVLGHCPRKPGPASGWKCHGSWVHECYCLNACIHCGLFEAGGCNCVACLAGGVNCEYREGSPSDEHFPGGITAWQFTCKARKPTIDPSRMPGFVDHINIKKYMEVYGDRTRGFFARAIMPAITLESKNIPKYFIRYNTRKGRPHGSRTVLC